MHGLLTSWYSLPYIPPCCVDESYSHVCVPKMYILVDDHVNFNHRRDKVILLFELLFPPMCESVSLVFLSHA